MNGDEVPKIDDVRETLSSLQRYKVSVIEPFEADNSLKPKIVWKIDGYIQAVLYRICDLAEAAINCYETSLFVPASILTRSTMETSAVFFACKKLATEVLHKKDIHSLDNMIMKLSFAVGYEDDTLPKAVNVLTHCDRVDRLIPGFRGVYDNLCEIVHPNYYGTEGFYSRVDKERCCINMSSSPVAVKSLTSSICTALRGSIYIFEITNDELKRIRPEVVLLCRELYPDEQ